MSRIARIPAGAIVLPVDAARSLSRAVFSSADFAARHGARIDPTVLQLAAEISSATGETARPPLLLDEAIQHELIDANTAAKMLGCSPRNVRDLASRDRIPGNKVAGRWQFTRDDIEVFRDWR